MTTNDTSFDDLVNDHQPDTTPATTAAFTYECTVCGWTPINPPSKAAAHTEAQIHVRDHHGSGGRGQRVTIPDRDGTPHYDVHLAPKPTGD